MKGVCIKLSLKYLKSYTKYGALIGFCHKNKIASFSSMPNSSVRLTVL